MVTMVMKAFLFMEFMSLFALLPTSLTATWPPVFLFSAPFLSPGGGFLSALRTDRLQEVSTTRAGRNTAHTVSVEPREEEAIRTKTHHATLKQPHLLECALYLEGKKGRRESHSVSNASGNLFSQSKTLDLNVYSFKPQVFICSPSSIRSDSSPKSKVYIYDLLCSNVLQVCVKRQKR